LKILSNLSMNTLKKWVKKKLKYFKILTIQIN
jgi:hypothetical protein